MICQGLCQNSKTTAQADQKGQKMELERRVGESI